MYRDVSRLIMYGNISRDSVLMKLSGIFKKISEDSEIYAGRETYVREMYDQVYRLLDIATRYGFDNNLWQCYIAYLLAVNENPFSVICEKVGVDHEKEDSASVNRIVKQDMQCFYHLFHYDFSEVEELLEVECFSILTSYRSMAKDENTYNKSVSEKVKELARELSEAPDGDGFFRVLTDFYKKYGVGKFGLNKAFRVKHDESGEMVLAPITHTSEVTLSHLVGYEIQKQKLIDNTEAFVEGRKANNCLLSVSYTHLRAHETPEHLIIEQVKNRNYRFIIYMDDLSFEEFEIEYKYLKAVIEGGMEVRPDNVLIYATSNRRHLIRETWSDRSDMSRDELHHSDTMQEKLSLAARFGVTINFSSPSKKEFEEIVLGLAAEHPDIRLTNEELLMKANAWSVRNGGYSGRVAEQFITYLKSVKA